jgi:hypothetical protein
MPDKMNTERNSKDDGILPSAARINITAAPDAIGASASTTAPAAATDQNTASSVADLGIDVEERHARFAELGEIVRSCAARSPFSSPWCFLVTDDTYLRIDMPSTELKAALKQDATLEALREFGSYDGVVNELQLPAWFEGDAPIYARIQNDKCTIVFSRCSEPSLPRRRTALNYAMEKVPPGAVQPPVTLFVVASQMSVDVLRRLGMRAVSCAGLERLSCNDIQRIFFGGPGSPSGWRYHLIFLDCDVAQLHERPMVAIGYLIQRLADMQELYGIDPALRFGVCRPRAKDFAQLKRAASFGDSAKICQLFKSWAATVRKEMIDDWRAHFCAQPASYSEARAALVRALQLSDVRRRFAVSAALPAYRAAGQTVVIEKFSNLVESEKDPLAQVDVMAAAYYAEVFFAIDPLNRAAEAVLAGKTPPKMNDFQDGLFDQLQRCFAEIRRIRRDRNINR